MNVLCVGSRVIGSAVAETLADAFIGANFFSDGERYVKRLNMIKDMETHFSEDKS